MKKIFDITGMTCAACAAHVERAVKKAGVEDVSVNLLMNRMTVDTDIDDDTVISAVQSAGYGASIRTNGSENRRDASADKSGKAQKKENDYSKTLLVRFIASLIFMLPMMYFSMGHMAHFPMGALDPHVNPASFALIQLVLTTPVLVINHRFFVSGVKAVLHRGANMDTLVTLGSGAAYIYGLVVVFLINSRVASGDIHGASELAMNLFFESAAMILTLVTLGKFLEAKSKGKTRSEVEKLMRLRPDTATVIRDGEETVVSVDEIKVGDTVVVLPGEYVPCDGTVTVGATTLDKSAITGESIPVEVTVGGEITSASLNLTGRVELTAQKAASDSMLARVIELIENAGGSKAPIQKIADKVSAVFVPVVCAISLVTLFVWLALGYGTGHALTMAISVLVISCPCALGLATPVAVMAGTGRAAAYGVLVKNAETLQSLSGVEIFALDKTATITEGKPRVTGVTVAADGFTREKVIEIAAALESTSTHPLASAIMEAYPLAPITPEKSEYKIGFGVVGTVGGVEYALGSVRLMESFGISAQNLGDAEAQTVYLCKRGEYIGAITVDDEVKPTSKAAIELMKSSGARVVMLTGDNEKQAERIAKAVGVTEVYCDVLPEDKLRIVEKLKASARTAMVGDGINDAPALKAADVGIAIGSGTDVAIDAADVVLVKSDLLDVPRAAAVSRMTLRNIKQNLFWAFVYNALGIPLAAGVLYALGVTLNPMIAAGAMAFSSLFVVCNALRLTVMRFDDGHLPRKLKRGKADESEQGTTLTSAGAENKDLSGDPDEENIINKGDEHCMETKLKVDGMSCAHCSSHVEKALRGVDGVTDVTVSLEKGEAVVKGNFDVSAAVKAVVDAGYDCKA